MRQHRMLMISVVVYLTAINGIDLTAVKNKISCRNLDNEAIDWFIIYKIPDLDKHPDKKIKQGVGFWYMDPATNGQWLKPNKGIDEKDHSLAFTIDQIYDSAKRNDTFHIMYNDEWPDDAPGESKNLGHCKGAMLFDKTSGFWLVHSVPKFPTKSPPYAYPATGTRYGQSMICISFHYAALKDIAAQLPFLQPSIYTSSLSMNIQNQIPSLAQVIKGMLKVSAPFNQAKDLMSMNGTLFKSFAKHKRYNKDLYYDFVAPSLQSSLFTETWQNGGGDLKSNCSSAYKVNNIDIVTLDDKIQFKDTKDHSKWAVTTDSSKPNVCIGDINRQRGQLKRGGGTICFRNENVWQTYKKSVNKIQDCPVRSKL